MRLRSILAIVFLIGYAVFVKQVSAQTLNRSVYLDPFFGGKENGPLVAHNVSAKDITLEVSQKLKQQLEKKSIGTILSRDRDKFVNLDQRVMMERSHGTNAYIAINVSKTKKDCIQLYFSRQTQSEPQKEKQNVRELEGTVNALLLEKKVKRSGQLAEAIYGSIKQSSVPLCLEKQMWTDDSNYDINYVVENAHSPVVIIDFGVSDVMASYVLDAAIMDKIIRSVSEGINEYLAASQSHK